MNDTNARPNLRLVAQSRIPSPSSPVERLYDGLTEEYDTDRFDLLARSRAAVLRQIERHVPTAPRTIVDMAVGTGSTLRELTRCYPNAAMTGIDISRGMLDIARQRVGDLLAIQTDVRDSARYLAESSIDLALSHYLLGYVEPTVVVNQAARALRPGGFFSIATSTFESFAGLQRLAASIIGEDAVRAGSKVPATATDLTALLQHHGLDVVAEERVSAELRFETAHDLTTWATRSGWFAQYFEGMDAAQRATVEALLAPMFPFVDQFDGLVVLATRNTKESTHA